MTYDEFRAEMNAYREYVDRAAKEAKESMEATAKLKALYRKFDGEERTMADRVVGEWLLSTDQGTRYDARALAWEFRLVNLLPIIGQLVVRLQASGEPGAPPEIGTIGRLIADLIDEAQKRPARDPRPAEAERGC